MGAHDAIVDAAPRAVSLATSVTRTRWWMLVLFSLMYLICYLDRGIISVAQPEMRQAFGLTLGQMGLVLAAFTWAYAIGQIPIGWLGDRFGPKRVLTALIVSTSACAILTGAAVGLWSLFAARFLLGIAESGAFPVASRGMQLWFAPSERGRIQGVTHFFSRFAVAITPLTAGGLLVAYGFRVMFYVFGAIGFLWVAAFMWFYRERPEDHPRVSRAELAHIRGVDEAGQIRSAGADRPVTPWRRILTSPNMWWIALGYACFFFGTNFYLTWYPTYLREHRGLSVAALGFWGSIPLFAGMAGDVVGGSISDLILKRTRNAKLARRGVAVPGFLLAGVFVIPAATVSDTTLSILLLATSFFFLEWVIGPAWAVPMDVGGRFSGTVTGVMNMAGALAASLTAIVYGSLFGAGYWVAPFLVSAAVMGLGALIWLVLIDPDRSVA
ncbi:MAG TPA: MFS transporter [Vicinamibacterales bacterium]|jgi:sugar phosphate permease|nr:MFS transporter [Vicinamibacterales bacterium]